MGELAGRVRYGAAVRSFKSRLGGRGEPPPLGTRAEPPGFANVRFVGDAGDEILTRFLGEPPRTPSPRPEPMKVLALSGGGAGGAFGAGALVGLSQAGQRPLFNLVTGVSTGALIAPFAFLGPAWDKRLTDAFTDGFASEAFALTALRPGVSLYPGEQLASLVSRYVDADLLRAVADAHRSGRRLFVATANLDAETTSIWDMGAIAVSGQEGALDLFATVMVASASLPGIFPPKVIAVECEGRQYEEMHVDGGAITPLFVVPEGLLLRRDHDLRGEPVEVYALFNTTLEPTLRKTSMSAVPILVRSFELMLRSSYRGALRAVAAFCEINGFVLRTGSVPSEYGGASMLRFDRDAMSEMFAHGASLARDGRLWTRR